MVQVEVEGRDTGALVTPGDRDPASGAVRSHPLHLRRPQVMTMTMRVETMVGAMTR